MSQSLKSEVGLKVIATDGEVGSVEEFYFEDREWTVRYVVVSLGGLTNRHYVLVSPYLIREVDVERGFIKVTATKTQIENSPDFDTARPINRQKEIDYANYYSAPFYWMGPFAWGPFPYPAQWDARMLASRTADVEANSTGAEAKVENGGTLRSSEEVRGYSVSAYDEVFGSVSDFLVDFSDWKIRYLVIDPVKWWPGRHVVVATEWIDAVSWAAQSVVINLTREQIEGCPTYDKKHFTRDYEEKIHTYFQRRPYWNKEARGAASAPHYGHSGDVEFEIR